MEYSLLKIVFYLSVIAYTIAFIIIIKDLREVIKKINDYKKLELSKKIDTNTVYSTDDRPFTIREEIEDKDSETFNNLFINYFGDSDVYKEVKDGRN